MWKHVVVAVFALLAATGCGFPAVHGPPEAYQAEAIEVVLHSFGRPEVPHPPIQWIEREFLDCHKDGVHVDPGTGSGFMHEGKCLGGGTFHRAGIIKLIVPPEGRTIADTQLVHELAHWVHTEQKHHTDPAIWERGGIVDRGQNALRAAVAEWSTAPSQ